MKRRDMLNISLAAASAGSLALTAAKAQQACPADGTPAQFVPKKAADPKPQVSDIERYPKCPYCGMDRKQNHATRMLIHYSDDLPDGVCSLHCAAISLSINIDREPKAIWVADNGPASAIKPLVQVDQAVFLVGSQIRGVMTARSKVAYGSTDAAKAAQAANGGELAGFDTALLAAYTDMAQDVSRIRKNRDERRRGATQQKGD
jgi:copper chaperone NosL